MLRFNRDISIRSIASSLVRLIAIPSLAAAFAYGALIWTQSDARAESVPASPPASAALKVCADPNNLPQSDKNGAGYENKLVEALARDLGRHVEYTFFPQRMGFVKHTLKNRDETTGEFKCDLIVGVPKGYEMAATTLPYMHSTYALVVPARTKLGALATPEDLLKLPKERLQNLHIGVFAQSPATDWLLRNGLIDSATFYAAQSGDPEEHPASIVERDLTSGAIDVAIVWGPVAGFLASRHRGAESWTAVPFKPDPEIRFDFEIAMGVRFPDKEWKDTLDHWIAGHRPQIDNILQRYRVPLLRTPAPQ
jgi:quinoprotein dehydrogenase-associated probable ABC transporter substrate-binding protein